MRMHNRWFWLTVLATVLLGACSRAELVYENADWLTYRWAMNLVDASAEQRKTWRGRFDVLLEDHREQLLPDVVDLLGQLERDAERGLTAGRLDCLFRQTDALYQAHARLAVPLAVDILVALSTEQVDHMADELAERNRDFADDYLDDDPVRRRTERVARYLERIERWTGTLDDGQRALLQGAIGEMPETAGTWFDYRQSKQNELLRLLRSASDRSELEGFLTAWWVDFEGQSESLTQDIADVRRRSIALAVAIDATLAPAQRTRAIERVAGLRSDLDSVLAVATASARVDSQRCG